MQLYSMNKELVRINEIKNISSISLEYIQDSIPLLIVMCNDGKIFNMCYNDPYFYEYVTKVYDTYLKEKDNEYIDDFGKVRKIEINENIKKLFENKDLLKNKSFYSFYNDKCHYDDSLLFQKDDINFIFPIIKYHIIEFFKHTDININLEDNLEGYKNNYCILSKINSIDKIIRLRVLEKSNTEYKFLISGIFDEMKEVYLNIIFDEDSIKVNINIPLTNIEAKYTYTLNEDSLKTKENIKKNCITLYNVQIETGKFDTVGKEEYEWYKLPWGATYGIKYNNKTINDYDLTETHSIYYDNKDNSIYRRERYSKKCGKKDKRKVILNEIVKQIKGLTISDKENLYLFETSFKGTKNQDGFYTRNHNEKYYYNIASCDKNIEDVTEEDLIQIDKVNVIDKSNLLDENMLLSLRRKEEK